MAMKTMTIGRNDFCKSVLLHNQTKVAVEICWIWKHTIITLWYFLINVWVQEVGNPADTLNIYMLYYINYILSVLNYVSMREKRSVKCSRLAYHACSQVEKNLCRLIQAMIAVSFIFINWKYVHVIPYNVILRILQLWGLFLIKLANCQDLCNRIVFEFKYLLSMLWNTYNKQIKCL